MKISTAHYSHSRSSLSALSLLRYTAYLILSFCLFSLLACSTPAKKVEKKQDEKYRFSNKQPKKSTIKKIQKSDAALQAISDLNRAQNALEKGDVDQASNLIGNQNNIHLLPISKQAEWWMTQSDLAYKRKDIQASILAEQQLRPLQNAPQRQERIDIIFQRLLQVDRFSLKKLANSMSGNNYARDWLSLTLAATSMPATIQAQKSFIKSWQKRHKSNPLSNRLPTTINQFLAASAAPRKVALLLPASGPLATYGKAIEEGFFSMRKGLNLQVQVYDVHNASSLSKAMNDMAKNGVDAVVGPIDKALASKLWRSKRFPSLVTLNYISPTPNPHNNYAQFGIAVEDEARLLAQVAAYNNKKNVLVIYEKDRTGTRALNAFGEHIDRSRYQTLPFTNTKDLARGISNKVNVSPAEIKQYRRDLKAYEKNTKAQKNSPTTKLLAKNTIDSVVVFASQINAAQIKPLLHFYYAFDTPVLASSSAYDIANIGRLGKEYEGIFIADVPVLGQPYVNWHGLITAQPKQFNRKLTRFYALGIDAAIASKNIHGLAQAPGIQIKGTTGNLSYDQKKQVITRSPRLYVVQKGNIVQVRNRSANCNEGQRLCL